MRTGANVRQSVSSGVSEFAGQRPRVSWVSASRLHRVRRLATVTVQSAPWALLPRGSRPQASPFIRASAPLYRRPKIGPSATVASVLPLNAEWFLLSAMPTRPSSFGSSVRLAAPQEPARSGSASVLPTKNVQVGLGLTRRCSGLTSFAAELHFVRPQRGWARHVPRDLEPHRTNPAHRS